MPDYKGNISQIYTLLKNNGATKQTEADFAKDMTDNPNARLKVYGQLKKWGTSGIGNGYNDFAKMVSPNAGGAKPKPSATSQQAAEVGQTMFGGGEETTALQQAQQQVQQIQQANKEQQQGQTREHLDNPQMQSLFGYKNMSNSRVVNDDSLWDEKGFKRPSGQPSIEEGERKAKENIGNVYERFINGPGTRIDEKGSLRSNDPLAALGQERSDRRAKALDVTRNEVKNTVGSVIADADKRWMGIFNTQMKYTQDPMAAIHVANQENDPEKVLEEVRSKVSENATKMIQSNMATYEKAAKEEGITTEEYIGKYVMPEISAQVEQEFDNAQMSRYMPQNAGEFIVEGLQDSIFGTLANMAVTTQSQRQYQQRATEEAGEKYGMGARLARMGVGFAGDAPVFAGTGKLANTVISKVGLGSLEKTVGKTMADRYLNFVNANLSGVERFASRATTGMAHGAINMGAYEGINGVVQTLNNGDTSLAGLGAAFFHGIRHGAVTGVAMGGVGSAFGELGSKLGMRQGLSRGENFIRATDKAAFQMLGLVGEGFSMHLGEQINSQIEGTGFNLTWEGTLENAIMAGVMKISSPSHYKSFKKNVASMFLAEPKDNPIRLSDDDKRELMKVTGSSSMEEVMTKIFPDGEKAEGNATNAQITEAQTRYLEMMNSLSWDAQNKISVALTGTACSARPRTGRFEADGNILYEYANDGTLLSTHEFKNTEEKNAYLYQKRLHQENVDFWGTYGKALLRDKDAVITAMTDIARQNGVQDEFVIKAMEKEPIRRTQGEREILRQIEEALHGMAFPKGEVHTEQSAIDGEKAAQDAEVTSDEPKTEVVNNTNVEVTQAMADFAEAMKDAVWKEDYAELKKQGMSDADIYNTLMEQYNEAELAPLADYVNAQAKQQGFMQGVANEIEQKKSEQTNLVTSGKVTINGVERTDGRVITLVDADGNIVRLLSGDFKLNEDGTIETEQPIIVSDDNGNPRPLNSVDGWKVAGSTDAGEYASYIRELLGQKATAVIDPNGEFAQPAPTEAPKETPKAETEVQRNESEGTTEAEQPQAEKPKAEVEAPKAEPQQSVAEESKPAPQAESEPTETKKDGIPLDENGKKNYVADGVRPVDAVNDIYNRGVFNTEQADAYVQSKIEEARKAYDKVNKDIAPKKGEDPDDYLARLQAHDAEVTAAKQVLDRWQAIYDEAHKFDAKEEETEDAMKTDDIDMRGLEDDPRYFIATHMLKITPESFNEQVGLGAREKRAMPGFLAKKENGGVSIFEATDHIMQFLKDQGITVDEDFVKNTIIDILNSGGPRSYIKRMREDFLANISREEAYERAKMDKDYLDNYGMEYDEYQDYLEAERQRVSELYRGVDEDALYAHHAEKWQEYEEAVAKYEADQKEIEETLNSKKNGQETGRTGAGDGLLRQEGARNEGRTGETSDKEGSVRPVRGVQDQDGLVPKEASGREAVENPSTEETKAETPKVDRLNDTTLSAEERIKGEKPLTEQEIDSLPDELFNDVVKTQIKSALEKLGNGDKLSVLEELFYLNALKHVRTTTERGAENSTDADGAQLADGGNARPSDGGEGGETGNVAGERGGETSEEQLRGQDSEGDLRTTAGVRGDREVRGGEPADDGVSTAGMESESGSGTGRNGSDVRKPKGEGTGSTTSGEATRDEIKSSIEARKKKLAELAKRIKKTPKNTPPRLYDAASALGAWIGKQIDSVDFVAVGEFSKETMLLGGDYLRLGIHDFKEWAKRVKGELGDLLKDTFDWKDAEVDDFIREMWNSKYEMDGETHTIAEWASILGDRELRKEISRSLDEKRQLQKDAENIEVKVGDKDNIDQTLPFLLPEQRGDVLKAETAFFGEKHQDRTHGYGKGMMFTNGTGTGKTYTGLGIVKRFVKQGKGRVLIVTPSQPKVADWVKDGQNLGLEVTPLENTKDAGNGVVCTTYANLRANEAVLRDTFDLIVYDESHKIMENKKGEETIGTAVHYQLSNKNKQHAVERVKMKYEPFRKEKELRQEADDTRNIQENAINKLRELNISLPKHPTNSAEIDEHIRAIEQEGENVEGNKEKLNYLHIVKNAFNRLDEIPREIEALKPEQEKLMPEIEKEAEDAVKRTKSVFLSATPFNTRESLKYAEGYLFSYPEEDKNTVGTYNHRSPEQAFLEQHFSAGYRWRYGRLEQHMENAEALAKQEVRFSDYLQDQLGTLSTRQIDNGYDYSRTFPTVTLDKAETFNQALQDVFHDKTMQPLWEAFHDVFYDYNKQTALFETMKTALAAERIREHLARGRKVVVFHRRRTTKDELQNPFQQALTIAKVNSENMSAQDKQKVADAIAAFHGKYGDLLKWEQGLDYRLPREQLADIFGEDKVAFFSGEETTKQKNQSIADFMKDNKGKDIIVIQEASGKEGISLHDQTGEHQRVQISLCLPQSPIAFIQSEGRIYRIGQKSNAVFEYPLLGLNLEINLWAHKFNNALGTTEYLAMGSKARNLSESIAKGIMENSGTIGYDDAGVGGKAYDGNVEAQTATGFDGAITDYFTNQKISAKRENREGVDYFPTPEPVGYKMVEWAGLTEGESALEPSAGHGAIARYVPKSNNLTMIEPSQSLMSKLVLNTPGSGRKYEGGTFEDYNVINKHDAIVMNPPYGAGGTTAVEHVAKGFKHLNEGGRLIAIIPDGPACDKKMQKWLESKDAESAVITGEIKLPSCTFGRAGTAVNTRIVVIDKVTREEVRNGMPTRKEVDLRSVTDVNELFEKIRDIDMPERTIDKEYLREKAAKNFRRKIADPDSANKFVVSFVEANQKFVRIDFKRGGVSLWIDVEEIQNNKDEALRSYRRIKERYDTEDASYRANRIFTMGRGSNKVEIREADIKRDIYQNAMEFVAKVAGTTVKELDTRNNELMERLRNGSKPSEQPQAEVKPQESRWDYSVVKHTQTGADLHIVKSKERMTDEEYRKELAKAKSLGGFYDRYSKGFRFETKENADKFMQQEGETRFSEDLNDNLTPSEEKKEYPFVWNRKKKALANIFRSATLEEAGSDVTEYLENHTDLFKGLSGSDEEVLKTINDMSETEYKEMRKVADAVYVPSYDEFHKMDASEQMEYVDDFRMKARGAREENLTSAKWLEENAPELISSIKFNNNNGERITAEQVRKMFGWDESVGIDDLSTEIDVDKLQTIVNSEKKPNTRFSEGSNEANRLRMGDKPETFKERQQRAVEQKGVVMPGLNEATVKVVDNIPHHPYTGDIKEATSQAIEAAKAKYAPNGEAKTLHYDNFGTEFDYSISGNAIDVLLSPKHQGKSVNKGAHLALAENIDKVISESIEVEEHPDRIKTGDVRDNNNINPDALMHRFYGVARIDGKDYRVMTLMREEGNPKRSNGIHSYEVQKIEVLDENSPSTPNGVGTPNSELEGYPLAKVIKDVGKTMEKDKNLLEESKLSDKLQSEVSKPEDKPTVRAHIDTVSKDLNTPCEVHNDASTIKNEKVRKAIESGRKVKGWWDKDGVHLYMPNIHSRHDAETTILHETVGHDGLRKLMNGKDGKSRNFQKFLDMVWADKKNTALHEFVKEYAPKNGWDLHEAVDEWLAREAEKPVTDENFGMWGRVKAMFNNALRALGFKSDMSLNDVRYAIWLSKRMKQKPNDPLMKARAAAFRWGMEHSHYKPEVKDGRYVDSEDGKDETRLAAPLTPSGAGLREKLERDLEQNSFAWSEAHLDDMRSLRGFMDIVADGKKIRDADNAYLMENHCGSTIMAKEQEWLGRKYAPINDAALEIMGRIGKSGKAGEDAIEEYMIKRSSLERNRVFFVRDAVNEASKSDKDVADRLADDWKQAKENADGKLISDPNYTLRDWCAELDNFIRKNIDKNYDPNKNDKSGVNWFDPNRNKDTFEFNEQTIIDDILDFESSCGGEKIGKFWDAVKDATDSTVDIAWECGDITGETRDHLKDMMNHYVPLRGYQEETAEDIFSYVTNGRGESYKPIRKALGRKSLAEHPLAHIRMLGYYSIARGEKNKVKQALYRFVTRNLDELKKQNTVSVSDVWEVKKTDPVTGKEEWEAVLPQYDAEWSDKKKADTIQQFYEDMGTLKAKGDARIAKDSSHIGMTFREQMNKNQHIVEVNINGKKKLLYFNYNPRVAQAINGKTKAAQTQHNWFTNAYKGIMHKMAGLYTSYNPEFAIRNFERDTIFAQANIRTKENTAYANKFTKNQGVALANIHRLFTDYQKGMYDNATRGTLEWYFREFMRNGGKTGYVQSRKIEEAQRAVAKGLDATDASALAKILGKGWEATRDLIEGFNDRIENINRFAAFVTSMQMGRGILRSVHDAKTVTVNFDRKGAGSAAVNLAKTGNEKAAAYTAAFGRGAYIFYNATMQGLAIMGTNAKRSPVKFSTIMVAQPLVAGMMYPLCYNLIASLLGNDDEDAYAKIPYWDRRNNICIPRDGKGGYIKISLPIDLRVFHGIGDIAASAVYMPTLKTENGITEDMISQLTQLSPVDFLQGGPSSWLTNLTPSVLQPIEQVKSNKAWTGKPIYKEDKYNTGQKSVYRVYPSVNSLLVGAAKGAHEMTRDYKSIPAELDVTGLDLHPSEMDYLLKAYLGSIYTMTDKIWSTGEAGVKKLKGEETDYEIGKFPIFGTMFGTQNEKNLDKATNAKYYNYLDEFKHAEYMLSGLKKVKGSIENIEFKNSDMGKRYYFYKDNYKDKINGLRKKIKNEKDDTERKKYERDLQEAQTEMVQALDRMN